MKLQQVIWRKSIFTRLVLTFLLIVSIVYILGVRIYNRGSIALQNQLTTSTAAHLSYYMDNLENEVKRIKNLEYSFINDDNLYKLSSIPDYIGDMSVLEAAFRLQQRIIAIKDSSTYINNAFVLIPSTGKMISSQHEGMESMDKAMYDNLKKISLSAKAQMICWNNRMFFSATYPLGNVYDDKMEPKYVVGVELSRSALERSLDQFKEYSEGGGILIHQQPEYTIESRPGDGVSKAVSSYVQQQAETGKSGTVSIDIKGKSYFICYVRSEYLDLTLCKYEQQDLIFKPLKQFQFQFFLFFSIALILVAVYSVFIYKYIQQPLSKLIKSFKRMESGELNVAIAHKQDDEFGYLYKRFNAMLEKLNNLIDQVYKQKILAQKAELKHLQSQINPHFLYNSFFILQNMVEGEDYDNAKYFASQMGSYFQFITRSASAEVPLGKEVFHARTYAEIMARRFRNRIRLEFDELPEKYKDLVVPRLILQPVIENAFEHGMADTLEDGLVSVIFSGLPGGVCISVEDNGKGMSESELLEYISRLDMEDGETTGIVNIHRRIRLKFGPDSGIEISKRVSGGLKISIKIQHGEGIGNV